MAGLEKALPSIGKHEWIDARALPAIPTPWLLGNGLDRCQQGHGPNGQYEKHYETQRQG
jgi:hypothetical protein